MSAQPSEVSALFDGELEPHEVRPVLRATVEDEVLRARWQTYALIGDQLRGEPSGAPDLAASVMACLAEEPVVLAPRRLQQPVHRHPLLALAASVAGVAVVGWLALADRAGSDTAEARLTAASPGPTLAAAVQPAKSQAVAAIPLRGDLSEYLVAHQTQSSSFRLGDGVQQVRAVTFSDRTERP
jgi:sigma-E factor negative regulatory protein RseA